MKRTPITVFIYRFTKKKKLIFVISPEAVRLAQTIKFAKFKAALLSWYSLHKQNMCAILERVPSRLREKIKKQHDLHLITWDHNIIANKENTERNPRS